MIIAEWLARIAAGLALLFCWAVTVQIVLFGILMFFGQLDFSEKSPLRKASEYTLVVLIISGTGALVLGGVAELWVALDGLISAHSAVAAAG